MPDGLKTAIFALAAFAAAGLAGVPLRGVVSDGKPLGRSVVVAARGGGTLWGILGGYRSIISDFAWIKGYLDWEKKDVAGCVSAVEFATDVDPYMSMFWTQGASMIAFDTPHWLLEKLPPERRNETALEIYKKRQAGVAFKLLDKGLAMFPNNSDLLLLKGQIALGISDFKLAEKCYAPLAEADDPPVYVRRIYASILAKNGEPQKAVGVLESVLSETEADSPIKKLLEDQIASLKRAARALQSR